MTEPPSLFFGTRKLFTASNLLIPGLTWPPPTTCPMYVHLAIAYWHLAILDVNPNSRNFLKYCFQFAQMLPPCITENYHIIWVRMGKSLHISYNIFLSLWKITGAPFSPNSITQNWYRPKVLVHAVLCQSSSGFEICQYPWVGSKSSNEFGFINLV